VFEIYTFEGDSIRHLFYFELVNHYPTLAVDCSLQSLDLTSLLLLLFVVFVKYLMRHNQLLNKHQITQCWDFVYPCIRLRGMHTLTRVRYIHTSTHH